MGRSVTEKSILTYIFLNAYRIISVLMGDFSLNSRRNFKISFNKYIILLPRISSFGKFL